MQRPFRWSFASWWLVLLLGLPLASFSLPACAPPAAEKLEECAPPRSCSSLHDGSTTEAESETPTSEPPCVGESCASEFCTTCEAPIAESCTTCEVPIAESCATCEATIAEPSADGRLETVPDAPPSEPSGREIAPEERQTEPLRPDTREIPPERRPEASPESIPEPRPRLQAKAVSLLSPLWQDHPQTGLMERSSQADLLALTVVLPAGSHTFAFRLDTQSQRYGRLLSASGQWPASGDLPSSSQGFTLQIPSAGRYTFALDLAQSSFSVAQEARPTAVKIEGEWDGKSGQTANLALAPDGSYTAALSLKKGLFRFLVSVQEAGQWKPYAARYPPHKTFPQGGSLSSQNQAIEAEIPQDDTYLLTVDPLHRRYHLHFAPDDPEARYNQLLNDLKPISSPPIKNDRISAFLRRLAALRQIPIIKPTAVIFLLFSPMVEPVHVAGSFNQWATAQAKMLREPGTDFYHLKVNLPTPDHYAYKFVDSATPPTWITDPLNRAFEYGPFGENSVANLPGSGKSHLERLRDIYATKLKNQRSIYLYLPPGSQGQTATRYPVAYMHDGQNLFDPQAIWGGWGVKERADQMLQTQTIKPMIVVGPANTPGRMDEYTHTQDRISGTTLVGGKALDYADFLLRDLKPLIDGLYPTKPGYRDTATLGSSLGGLISLWLGVHYPDAFFRIGALSSTYGWGKIGAQNPTLGEIIQQEAYKNLVIYTDSGSPQDNYQVTLQMRSTLEAKGYLHDLTLRHWTEIGAIHNEQAWKDRLDRPFSFLLAWP